LRWQAQDADLHVPPVGVVVIQWHLESSTLERIDVQQFIQWGGRETLAGTEGKFLLVEALQCWWDFPLGMLLGEGELAADTEYQHEREQVRDAGGDLMSAHILSS